MKKTKKVLCLLLCMLMLGMSMSACGSNGDNKSNGKNPTSEGEVEITWWTSYSIVNTELMQTVIDQFNELHKGEYHVTLLFAGGTSDLRSKLVNTSEKELPSMVTGQPIETAYFDAQDIIATFQDFVDADDEDWTSTTYDVVKESYRNKEGKFVGWPFGVSCGGWLVNTDMLAKAGYSIDNLTSFEKIAKVAEDMVNKKIAKYGIAFYTSGAELYDAVTLQGADFLNNDNGHNGEPTEAILMEEPTHSVLKKYLDLFTSLYKNKCAYTFGSDTSGEILPAFVQQNLAIAGCTNSFISRMLSYNPSFNWTFIPNTAVDDSGEFAGYAIPEGHGTYIINTGDKREMQGAYEVIKFFAEAENQAYWCANTGYIPYTEEAYNDTTYQDWMISNYPDAVKLKEILLATPDTLKIPYTEVAGVVTSACRNIQEALCETPEDIERQIEKKNADMNESIEIYALRRK